jgi:ArsR family transcriptional regulator, lead/cadmium/zinc/bismuth-responsive transcriptional repressor
MNTHSYIKKASMLECDALENHAPLLLREDILPTTIANRMAAIFRALADPTRVRLVAELAKGEACVGDLADAIELSQSAVSHQLGDMRAQGLVRSRRDGRHIFYALDDEHVQDLFSLALTHVQHQGATS